MWFSNPIADPLFYPFLKVAICVLGLAFVVLLVLERRRLRQLRRSELFKRLFTWTCIVILYSVAILSGRLPVMLFACLMIFQALREYAILVALPPIYRWVLLGMGLTVAPTALYSSSAFYTLPVFLLLLATLQPLLLWNVKSGVRHTAFAAFGWAYIAWLLGHFVLLYVGAPRGAPGSC